MRRRLVAVAGLVASLLVGPAGASEPVRLYAAGSLREALTEIARLFEAREGVRVEARFGASGLLRDEIAAGARAEVFASANMEHPASLAGAGRSGPVVPFARNRMCALARPGLDVDEGTLVDRMLDPAATLGTSTPGADPSGDYAWAVFGRIDAVRRGAGDLLQRKALQLTGGPASPPPPAGRSAYGALIAEGRADLFLTYCTNAQVAAREVPGARVVDLPGAIAVAADYGLTVLEGARPEASRLALFVLSPEGQEVLARLGFAAPTLPGARLPGAPPP